MKRFFDPCARYRRDSCLLAGGVLPEPRRLALEQHLATCTACQNYHAEIKALAVPLANWEGNFAGVEVREPVKAHWSRVIRSAGRPEAVRGFTPITAFHDWCRDVLWPWRRVWVGLAAIWVVILAGNISLHGPSPIRAAKSSPSPQEMILTFKDQQKILADLLGGRTSESDPPKRFLPKPRTEGAVMIVT